jgi:hypothetical protein
VFDGLVDGSAWALRGRSGGVPSEQGSSRQNRAPHRRVWLYSDGEVKEKMRSAHPASPCRPGGALSRRSYTARGCSHTLSRGTMWGKDESRWHNTGEWSGLSAQRAKQCPYSTVQCPRRWHKGGMAAQCKGRIPGQC